MDPKRLTLSAVISFLIVLIVYGWFISIGPWHERGSTSDYYFHMASASWAGQLEPCHDLLDRLDPADDAPAAGTGVRRPLQLVAVLLDRPECRIHVAETLMLHFGKVWLPTYQTLPRNGRQYNLQPRVCQLLGPIDPALTLPARRRRR